MESRRKSNQDSNSDLPERATKCIQLLSLSSYIVAQEVSYGSTIRKCMCVKNTGCLLTGSEFSCSSSVMGFPVVVDVCN
ncbi:hypothetical protein M514_07872 [Trichuris suis]|uniref:Uncharacterized protein n=1 Tax=Trichuris suis TaxID=68888 RepID=A0A085N339_9BILA|nr:hypothetical protein M514_07872 [Trichuris suis]